MQNIAFESPHTLEEEPQLTRLGCVNYPSKEAPDTPGWNSYLKGKRLIEFVRHDHIEISLAKEEHGSLRLIHSLSDDNGVAVMTLERGQATEITRLYDIEVKDDREVDRRFQDLLRQFRQSKEIRIIRQEGLTRETQRWWDVAFPGEDCPALEAEYADIPRSSVGASF